MRPACSVAACLWLISYAFAFAQENTALNVQRRTAPEAGQAVAVDAQHYFAIANTVIVQYDRFTNQPTGRWQASEEFPLKHLNSGIVHEGRLYCAHSNFPAYPEASSIEVFDATTLVHLASHSLGIAEGSLTCIVPHSGKWWAVYAHYTEKVNENPHALDHRCTSLVRMDGDFRREAGWVFPTPVLDRFAPHSCSGAAWGPDGLLYCTGHDRGEVYALELPKAGSELRLVKSLELPITGQGICWDPLEPGVLWGIDRPHREVLSGRLLPPRVASGE